MKRLLLILAFLLAPLAAQASNCSGYPYTLVNGQTADANQVMSNFNNILTCANNNLLASPVQYSQLAPIATNTILGNNTGSSLTPLALTTSQTKTLLAITNTDVAGLGGAALLNVGTTAGTAAAGNDSRFTGPTQNSQSAAYGLLLTDAGGQIYHPSADVTARTWTIPANASVAYLIGTKIDLVNDCSAGVLTIAITTDTLVFFTAGTTGSRTIAACGEATLTKVSATRWIIVGVGVT